MQNCQDQTDPTVPYKRSALSSSLISFNKLGEEARAAFRLLMLDMMSDDAEILMDEDDVSIGNSNEEMDTSNDMSFDDSEEEVME